MREIKFRAWAENHKSSKKEMVYWSLLDNDGGWIKEGFVVDSELDPIMQYTCLKDKNGKEIYEGDVVATKWQKKAEMIWVESEAAFGLRTIDDVVKDEIMYGFKDTEMEVIGNIYQDSHQ